MASNMNLASFLANMRMPAGVDPVVVNLPRPPKLEGALTPNTMLSNAVRFAENVVSGPESMVLANGYVYTGMSDGWVAEINPQGQRRNILRMSIGSCGQPNAPEDACGRPLGIRERDGYLYVADAYNGIFKINPTTGRFLQLVNSRVQRVNGKPLGFINDLVLAKDGTIFFTSSSTKYSRTQFLDIILEGETSGRVLVYNPRVRGSASVQELVTKLNFANGLELSKDEDYLLISEGARARIFKAYIGANSPKRGRIEPFIRNLPGFVDNIRRTPRGTYWVGLSRARHAGLPSVLDKYGNQPNMRGAIMGMPREAIMQQAPKYAMSVEVDGNGNILRSLQDPTGKTFVAVSELQEENGNLYIGSFDRPFIGKLKVADLPPVFKPGTPPGSVNQQLAVFLQQVRERLMSMDNSQVRDIVITLVQRLVEAKLEALTAQSRTMALQNQVKQLQNRLNQLTATTPVPPTQPPTTPAATTSTAAATTTSSGAGQQTTTQLPPTTTAAPTTTASQSVTTTAAAATTTGAAVATTTGEGGSTTTASSGSTTAAATTTPAGTTAAEATTTGAATTTTSDTTTA